ncbi:hypothetical protein Tco_1190804, partial [Tanacetum coccineum]
DANEAQANDIISTTKQETKEREKVVEGGWTVVTRATGRTKTASGTNVCSSLLLAAGSLGACLPGNGVRIVASVGVPAQKALLGGRTPRVNAAANDTNETKSKLKEDKEEEEKAYVWPEWLTKGGKKKSQSGGTIPDVTGQQMVVGTGKYTTVKPKQATEGVTSSLQQTRAWPAVAPPLTLKPQVSI